MPMIALTHTLLVALIALVAAAAVPAASARADAPDPTFALVAEAKGSLTLKINYCANDNYAWFQPEQVKPIYWLGGRAVREDVHNCRSETLATEVVVGDVIRVGFGTSTRYPRYTEGSRYWYVERTQAGLNVTRAANEDVPLRPLKISKVNFLWSGNYGGSIIINYCMNAEFHSLNSAEITPGRSKHLGFWQWEGLYGCEGRYAATGVEVNDIIEMAISANEDLSPENYEGDYLIFQVKRTANGLECKEVPFSSRPLTRPINCASYVPAP